MITLNQIKNVTFEKAGKRGYQADAVDDFIDDVIELVESMQAQVDDADGKIELLADKLEEYRKDEDSLRAALLGAQKLGNSVVAEAKQKAEIILRDANIKSESLLSKSEDKIDFYKSELVRMKGEVTAFKNSMLALYRDHIELISQIPAEAPEEVPAEEAAVPAESAAETAEEAPAQPEAPAVAQAEPAAGEEPVRLDFQVTPEEQN